MFCGKKADMSKIPIILSVETSSRIGSVALANGDRVLGESNFSAPLRHSAEIFPIVKELVVRFGFEAKQINEIYISVGPGSFTGLRIAVTIAKAMHLAQGTQVVAIDTMDVIASNVIDITNDMTERPREGKLHRIGQDRIAVILDAKRGQFFIAAYQRRIQKKNKESQDEKHPIQQQQRRSDQQVDPAQGTWEKILPDRLLTTNEFIENFSHKDMPISLLGDGLLYHCDKFKSEGIEFFDEAYWSPRAEKVHLLGRQKAKAGEYSDPVTLTPIYLRAPQVTLKTR
jgi:tRNA threonylcarbamoyl adenosine modification protein YeaZ